MQGRIKMHAPKLKQLFQILNCAHASVQVCRNIWMVCTTNRWQQQRNVFWKGSDPLLKSWCRHLFGEDQCHWPYRKTCPNRNKFISQNCWTVYSRTEILKCKAQFNLWKEIWSFWACFALCQKSKVFWYQIVNICIFTMPGPSLDLVRTG